MINNIPEQDLTKEEEQIKGLQEQINSFQETPNEDKFETIVSRFQQLYIGTFLKGSRYLTASGRQDGEYLSGTKNWDNKNIKAVIYQKDINNRVGIIQKDGKFYTISGTGQSMEIKAELKTNEVVDHLQKLAKKAEKIYQEEEEKRIKEENKTKEEAEQLRKATNEGVREILKE